MDPQPPANHEEDTQKTQLGKGTFLYEVLVIHHYMPVWSLLNLMTWTRKTFLVQTA